jgi:hypothetical protein
VPKRALSVLESDWAMVVYKFRVTGADGDGHHETETESPFDKTAVRIMFLHSDSSLNFKASSSAVCGQGSKEV